MLLIPRVSKLQTGLLTETEYASYLNALR
ncbi:hypothetical protein MES5069_270077 [Mesorhizobium escarrei]|uniref:Uncharacterized protein n=1 Tax=Mesorhizobium escarrei TaxID=666018 RepID=A0ABM9DXA5_9HYPH|nr:hypothetical protein MES5069_270077 [Mesorhizobium escarrei]